MSFLQKIIYIIVRTEEEMYKKTRGRGIYLILIFIVIALGLASRKFGSFLPGFISTYAGDTLWGLMVFLIIALIFNKKSSRSIASMAILISAAIEFSQLYQSPWINSIRDTTLGGLILGFGFLWSDLVCYLIGIMIGFALDYLSLYKRRLRKYYY